MDRPRGNRFVFCLLRLCHKPLSFDNNDYDKTEPIISLLKSNHIGTYIFTAGTWSQSNYCCGNDLKYSFTNVFCPSLNILEQLKLMRMPLGDFNSFI